MIIKVGDFAFSDWEKGTSYGEHWVRPLIGGSNFAKILEGIYIDVERTRLSFSCFPNTFNMIECIILTGFLNNQRFYALTELDYLKNQIDHALTKATKLINFI